MVETAKLGPWVRRFLLEHLVADRNLSPNTQRSYRDTLVLLIPFVVKKARRQADQLLVSDVSPDLVRQFLLGLENSRRSSVSTRNQRLAAIRSLASYIGLQSPEHVAWSGEIRAIPFKRFTRSQVSYLEKSEMDALLAQPNRKTVQGQRDYRLLLFLYNTGARASEVAGLCIKDLDLARDPDRAVSSVTFLGKECHSYCISLRPRYETTGKHIGQQACDLAFSLADSLLVARIGIGLGPYTDAHGAGRVGPMSEPYRA